MVAVAVARRAAQQNQQQQQIPPLPAHDPGGGVRDGVRFVKGFLEEPPASPATAEQASASSNFLSQILGASSTPPPQQHRIEMPDDVKAWLVYGGASNAAAEAEQRDDGPQTMAEGAAAAAAASELDEASAADAARPCHRSRGEASRAGARGAGRRGHLCPFHPAADAREWQEGPGVDRPRATARAAARRATSSSIQSAGS